MKLEEIKDFLRNKKGYLKEGSKRLRSHLRNKGFTASVFNCKTALREVNAENRDTIAPIKVIPKVLFYDIETSYNIVKSWRVGYNMTIQPEDILHERKIICVSYSWLDDDMVYNITWDENQDDKELLITFIDVLNQADLIVAHNGEGYDLPWIRTRALLHDLPMRINYKQFDTLKVARRKFNFNSNKLDYISTFLGFGHKIKTNMALWDEIILRKCETSLAYMVEYCNKDVLLLEKVYKKLMYHEVPMYHKGVVDGKAKYTSPYTGTDNIEFAYTTTTPAGTTKRVMKDLDTGQLFDMSESTYKKYQLNK
jgi:predicted PolB exonuclease-like 3'-5' exonuclease